MTERWGAVRLDTSVCAVAAVWLEWGFVALGVAVCGCWLFVGSSGLRLAVADSWWGRVVGVALCGVGCGFGSDCWWCWWCFEFPGGFGLVWRVGVVLIVVGLWVFVPVVWILEST